METDTFNRNAEDIPTHRMIIKSVLIIKRLNV